MRFTQIQNKSHPSLTNHPPSNSMSGFGH